MDYEGRKDILRKLVKDELSAAERQSLNESREVVEVMRKQWDASEDINDPELKSRIFNNISKIILMGGGKNGLLFYKLSLAASIALIIGLSVSVYLFSIRPEAQHTFIASSGIQNMTSVALADGSTALLGPGSKLTYPEAFTGKTREITLSGQAFFDVKENRGKPFVVHSGLLAVTVLGTAFELFSYEVESRIEVILLHGKVKVGIAGDSIGKEQQATVQPNEKLTYDKQTQEFTKEQVDANKYTAWRNRGILTFEDEKLSMIIPRLEQWYGQKIICQTDIAEEYRFTFKVRDESLERILFILGESSPLKYTKTEGGDFILGR